MARASGLTFNKIKGLKPKDTQYYEWDVTGKRGQGRLGVRVNTSGEKVFVYRYFVEGKAKFIQLGLFPSLSLEAAEQQVREFAGWMKAGVDPKSEIARISREREVKDKAEAEKGSIQQLIESYIWKMKADGKRTHADVLRRLEKDVYPVIPPATKAKDVTPLDIKQILTNMIQRGAVVQSNRVRSYLHAAYQYGLTADLDPMNNRQEVIFGLTVNPVSVVPRQASAEKVGENWLSKQDLCRLMESFSEAKKVGWMIGQFLKLCVYTGGQRPYELSVSEWQCVNWDEKTLLIIADISKNKREHLIPLTDSALHILSELKQRNTANSKYIFPQRGGLKPLRTDSFSQAISYYREQYPDFPFFIGRDIRRTCKTLMGELGISKELRDRIQNHAFQDVSTKHYDRYSYLPEKRRALEAWEARLAGTDPSINVVNFSGGRS
ncbi:MAG: tyrosine-type recombinase/integrase [Trichlorobacter sp.]